MKLISLNIILILTFFISCRRMPLQEMKKLGISQEEIDITTSLKGKNGVNGYYLIVRQQSKIINPNIKNFINNIELFTPENKLVPLTNYDFNQSEIIYFEFIKNELVIIEKVFSLRNRIRISRYNLVNRELKKIINAEVACEYARECEWIKFNDKKLAFFTNNQPNNELKLSSIYEYDWQTNNTKLIFEGLPFIIDAVTGRNLELKDVKYNRQRNEFEYVQ